MRAVLPIRSAVAERPAEADNRSPQPSPGALADASKATGAFAFTGDGENVKAAVGVEAGGRITPGGTRRIVTVSGAPVSKSEAGCGRDDLHAVAGQTPQVPNRPPTGLGGAV